MIIESIFILAFIATLCSMDMTVFGQFMICRPIFCAPLFGYLMGDISTGLWIGMIVEMVWINAIPMGVAVPVDVSSISILATYWACKFFPSMQGAAIWGMIIAVPFAYLYKEIDVFGRRFNTKIMHWVEKGVENNKDYRIDGGIFISLSLFILRTGLFYLFAMFIGGFIFKEIYINFPNPIIKGLEKSWFLLPMLGFGAVFYNFRAIKLPFVKR